MWSGPRRPGWHALMHAGMALAVANITVLLQGKDLVQMRWWTNPDAWSTASQCKELSNRACAELASETTVNLRTVH